MPEQATDSGDEQLPAIVKEGAERCAVPAGPCRFGLLPGAICVCSTQARWIGRV